MLETCKQTKKPVNTLLQYDSATLYSLSDFIVFYVPVITIINIIHLVLFAKLNHESIQKNPTWVSWLMFAIQRLVKYISIQETHYIVPLIRSSPIENKLQCVVLLRFANCISSALQKPIEIKCKLHDETHDTLSLIRL